MSLPLAALNAVGVLKQASSVMGADHLKTVRYTATGSEFILGQSATPGGPWPKYNLESIIWSFDYESGSWSEELLGQRTRAEMPPRGGGEPSLPRGTTFVKDGYVWSQIGPRSISRPWSVEDKTHQLWITPHGVIKAAIRNNASLQWQTRDGKSVAVISFTEPGRFSAAAVITEDNLVERVESCVDIPFYGEMTFVTVYSDYKDVGSIKFPTRIKRSQGEFPILDVVVKDVQCNVAVDIEVPDSLKQAPASPRMTAVKLSDGLWYVPGSHNCAAIEMTDHIVVVEAPLMTRIATAVFDGVKQAIPNKPIRYVINTHHHIDHSGGLRAAVAEGATIITHALNGALYQRYLSAPRTLAADELAEAKKTATLKTVDDKLVMRDDSRVVEIHHMRGNRHADDLLMVYLPKERLLIEADGFSPGPPNSPPPAQVDVFSLNLVENIERLKLSIDRILPLHGPIVQLQELYRAVGRSA